MNKQTQIVIKESQGLEIHSAKDMSKAVEMLSKLNVYLDELTIEKEKVTKPMLLALKNERERFKPLEQQLETAISEIRRNMSLYQTEQVRLERIEEAKIEDRVKAGKGNLKIETAVKKMNEIERADSVIKSESGVVKFQTVKILKVLDRGAIPFEYFDLNESRLTQDLKSGKNIPGAILEEIQRPMNLR